MCKLAILVVVPTVLMACQPAATPQPTPLLPTTMPPTAIPPTARPSPLPTTAPLEALAGSIDDLVGVWFFAQGPLKLEFKPDATYRVWDEFSGTQAEGEFTLETGKIAWVTSEPTCSGVPATYAAYVSTQEGKRVGLRLEVV